MERWRRHFSIVLATFCFAIFVSALPALYVRPRQQVSVEMQVALPRFVQVIMASGDRFLAANFAGFRTLFAATENMGPENFRIQALVQKDIAWLNPAHEDNYYIAAAFLPWNNQLEAAQEILSAATQARPFDWQPPFYYAFNLWYFLKRPADGAAWLRTAADHAADEMQTLQLQQLAANWLAKDEDLGLAVRIHRAMAKETKNKAFAVYLEKRAIRLENLISLEEALKRYTKRLNVVPERIEQLIESGDMTLLPVDPFGAAYTVDKNGRPQITPPGR